MRKNHFIYTLTCFFFLMLAYGCEKADIQKSVPVTDSQIQTRTEDCEDCGVDDCCCGIELQDPISGNATLSLCGTSDGTGTCSGAPNSPCTSFSGGGQSASLNSSTPKKAFCMVKGNAFWIANLSSVDTAYIDVTCQHDLTHPQILHVKIPPSTRYYYSTNNSCDIAACP